MIVSSAFSLSDTGRIETAAQCIGLHVNMSTTAQRLLVLSSLT
jgi:hypothetical protein